MLYCVCAVLTVFFFYVIYYLYYSKIIINIYIIFILFLCNFIRQLSAACFSSMWVGTLHSTATELQIQALGLLESAWTFL